MLLLPDAHALDTNPNLINKELAIISLGGEADEHCAEAGVTKGY